MKQTMAAPPELRYQPTQKRRPERGVAPRASRVTAGIPASRIRARSSGVARPCACRKIRPRRSGAMLIGVEAVTCGSVGRQGQVRQMGVMMRCCFVWRI